MGVVALVALVGGRPSPGTAGAARLGPGPAAHRPAVRRLAGLRAVVRRDGGTAGRRPRDRRAARPMAGEPVGPGAGPRGAGGGHRRAPGDAAPGGRDGQRGESGRAARERAGHARSSRARLWSAWPRPSSLRSPAGAAAPSRGLASPATAAIAWVARVAAADTAGGAGLAGRAAGRADASAAARAAGDRRCAGWRPWRDPAARRGDGRAWPTGRWRRAARSRRPVATTGWVVLAVRRRAGRRHPAPVRRDADRALLVDVGPGSDSAVADCVRDAGIRRLVVVLTHFHADHVDGLAAVLDALPVVGRPDHAGARTRARPPYVVDLRSPARRAGCGPGPRRRPPGRRGHGPVVLWPARRMADPNNASLVARSPRFADRRGAAAARAAHRRHRARGPGRAAGRRSPGGRRREGAPPRVAPSGPTACAQRSQPEDRAGEVGRDNDYGHPRRRHIDQYRAAGAVVGRTDLQGALAVVLTDPGRPGAQHRRSRPSPGDAIDRACACLREAIDQPAPAQGDVMYQPPAQGEQMDRAAPALGGAIDRAAPAHWRLRPARSARRDEIDRAAPVAEARSTEGRGRPGERRLAGLSPRRGMLARMTPPETRAPVPTPPATLTLLSGSEPFLLVEPWRAWSAPLGPSIPTSSGATSTPRPRGLRRADHSAVALAVRRVSGGRRDGSGRLVRPGRAALRAGFGTPRRTPGSSPSTRGAEQRTLEDLRSLKVPGGVEEIACAEVKRGRDTRELLDQEASARRPSGHLGRDGRARHGARVRHRAARGRPGAAAVRLRGGSDRRGRRDRRSSPASARSADSSSPTPSGSGRALVALQRLRWGTASESISPAGAVGSLAAGLRGMVRVGARPGACPTRRSLARRVFPRSRSASCAGPHGLGARRPRRRGGTARGGRRSDKGGLRPGESLERAQKVMRWRPS